MKKYITFHLLAFAVEGFGLYHAIKSMVAEDYSIPMRCTVVFIVFVLAFTALHYKKEIKA